MSRRRSKRFLSEGEKQAFLAEAGKLRAACVRMHTRGPIRDPLYASISHLMQAIDAVAEVVTGNRAHFHIVQHSATPHLVNFQGAQATAAGEVVSLPALGAAGVGRCGGE